MPQAPVLLDLTRLVSRAGRGVLTGVDRVELAWLQHLIAGAPPAFALVRSTPGLALLDRAGMAALCDRITGAVPWGSPDLVSRLHLRQPPERRRALSDVRRHAMPGCAMLRRANLPRALRSRMGAGFIYLNTGHAHLEALTLRAIRAAGGARIAVLLHDVIPLVHPEFSRAGQDAIFRRKIAAVAEAADRIIYNSQESRRAAAPFLAQVGRVPPGVVAPLGVPRPCPVPDEIPPGLLAAIANRPFFMTIGTIEPRKNHALLLDLWEDMARKLRPVEVPALLIAGARGWRNAAVFERLDHAARARPQTVIEAAGLSDGALAALLAQSRGLLWPSLAEGFGLPVAEAAALGVPVLCNDLAVTREIVGDYAVYANVSDAYSWHIEIRALAQGQTPQRRQRADLPTWAEHFETSLRDL